MTQIITKENFKETITNNKLVLIDFYAAWCGPCKKLLPTIEQLAVDFEGTVVVSKADAGDECSSIASEYNISSVPTILIFKNGEVVETLNGIRSLNQLTNILNNIIREEV